MIEKNNIRSYEVSIWTLQDSFITVLKPSNLESKGQIINPTMVLKDDGDTKFSFSIPMYIKNDNGKLSENPLWYNMHDGVIFSSFRKIKVIFNKQTKDEAIFEFVITSIQEEHEGKKKECYIECEGLAFHELGHQGYKITLEGADELKADQRKFFEDQLNSGFDRIPQNNINYWADKVFKNSNWEYSVQMDWSIRDGFTHKIYRINNIDFDSDNYETFTEEEKDKFNIALVQDGFMRKDKIYEDSYVKAWDYDEEEDKLIPSFVEEACEKFRMVEEKESNRYNLSQAIAQTFQVFCKYKYSYDENYHIIKREAIFYNNFLDESNGVIDLTYNYNTEHLTRIMDGTDLTTKMFVEPLSDSSMPTGEVSIVDAEANKSLEDYLLNFDYLLTIGTITQEQYNEIEPYQIKLHNLNKNLTEITNKLIIYENEKITQEARKKTAEDSLTNVDEIISDNKAAKNALGNNGIISITSSNPHTLYLEQEKNKSTYSCSLSKIKGIDRTSVKLYWSYNSTDHTVSDECTQYNFEEDNYGNVNKIININKTGHNDSSYLYATFNYSPEEYYQKIIDLYTIKKGQDEKIVTNSTARLNQLNELIDSYNLQKETNIIKKNKIINKFENLMGPALREGTWKPEDSYSKYGEVHEETLHLINTSELNDTGLLSLGWDSELLDDEQDFTFAYGITLETHYYPCIAITKELINTCLGENKTIYQFLKELTFIYDTMGNNKQKDKQYFTIGSRMVLGFLRNKDTKIVTPVLILLGAQSLDNEKLAKVAQGKVGFVEINSETLGQIDEVNVFPPENSNSSLTWLVHPLNMDNNANSKVLYGDNSNYEIVYPRFQINSLTIKNPNSDIYIKQNDLVINNYEDFYVIPRTTNYCVTIKPETFLAGLNFNENNSSQFDISYIIHFIISTAPLAIYLDAIKVLTENSSPKVSYEIDLMSNDKKIIRNTYARLGQIAHINDSELKFENTMGYISEVNLNLDQPWEDKIIIKNYKTKFEDLFSTIVASSEQMQKNASLIDMATSAFSPDGTLTAGTLSESLLQEILKKISEESQSNLVIPPATRYLEYQPMIRAELLQLYKEVGEILAAAQDSVNSVDALNLKNADILKFFKDDVKEKLTPTFFEDDENGFRHNTVLNDSSINFKVGDVWKHYRYNSGGQKIQDDQKNDIFDIYIATENSSQVYTQQELSNPNVLLKSLKGWSLSQDGSLAQIKGASLDINTKDGIIDLKAQNKLNISSGGSLTLAGEDVQITGNKTVQIGGPDIKIYSANINNNIDYNKGVHIYSSTLDNYNENNLVTQAIDITGKGIEMRAANGIRIQSGGGGISFSETNNENISVIEISRDRGIWLGSNKEINLFSMNFDKNTAKTGASARISGTEILFGVSDSGEGTAVKLTRDAIVFGAGNVVNGSSYANIGKIINNSGTTGIQITKDLIGMVAANMSENNAVSSWSYFSLTKDGLILSNTGTSGNGGIVQISEAGVKIGTENNTLITNGIRSFKNGTNDVNKKNTAKFEVYAPNFIVDSDGQLYATNAYISGKISASSGQIGNWYIDNNNGLLYGGNNTIGSANSIILSPTGLQSMNSIGGSPENTNNTWVFSAGPNFGVTNSGTLYAKSATISGKINATSGTFGETTNNKITIGKNGGYSAIYAGGKSTLMDTSDGFYLGGNGISLGASTQSNNVWTHKFLVNSSGKLYATDAIIKGEITATSLTLSGATIPYSAISDPPTIPDAADLTGYIKKDGTIGSTPADGATGFNVSSAGLLTASNAIIYGTIYASAGTIGGCSINSGKLSVPVANISGTITAGAINANTTISSPTIEGGAFRVAGGSAVNTGWSVLKGGYSVYVDSEGVNSATINATTISCQNLSVYSTITGSVSGSSGSCTGNAATATTATSAGYATSAGTVSDGAITDSKMGNNIRATHLQGRVENEWRNVDDWELVKETASYKWYAPCIKIAKQTTT